MDHEIQQLVREGRRDEAIARLLPAYRDRVFALCLGILGSRAAADDAAQEAFVKVWRALPAFDGRAALSTWIYAIARNTALSALRARRPGASLSDPAVLAEVESRYADESPATDAAKIGDWVARLPERQRRVVRLYYLRECSVEDVADLMAIPVGSVKTLLHRARERLRELAGVEDT